ncbi:MAG: hypothetical protein CR991_06665 [Proteobacteria bacterium]|nr:MAG: hypothetical protein CR991_06665 [Pseudomonadota bacterium]
MDRTIKILATCSVLGLTATACAPNNAYGPYNNQYDTQTGTTTTTTSPVSTPSVVATTAPTTVTQPPVYNGPTKQAVTHSHGGRVHSHRLPASGLNHTHTLGGGGSRYQPPRRTYTPPRTQPTYQPPRQTYTPPRRQPTYQPPRQTYRVPVQNQTAKRCWHGTNAKGQCNPAPGRQSAVVAPHPVRPQQPVRQAPRPSIPPQSVGNGNAGYYDYTGNQAVINNTPVNRTNSANYYDQVGTNNTANSTATTGSIYDNASTNRGGYNYYNSGNTSSSSSSYDTAQPKTPSSYYTSSTYTEPAPTTSNTFTTSNYAPNDYTGGSTYTVKRGDTVFQVMRNTGVYWKDIIRINNLQAPNYQINPGQVLRLR